MDNYETTITNIDILARKIYAKNRVFMNAGMSFLFEQYNQRIRHAFNLLPIDTLHKLCDAFYSIMKQDNNLVSEYMYNMTRFALEDADSGYGHKPHEPYILT